MKNLKRLGAVLSALSVSIGMLSSVCLPQALANDADFILDLTADKTDNLSVGDVVNVTVTPNNIKFAEGICSYDASAITYDTTVFSADVENTTCNNAMLQVMANDIDGVISLMVVDTSTGAVTSLHDGDGAVTLKFTVISLADEAVISLSDAKISGTVANDALDGCEGEAGEDLIFPFEKEETTPPVVTPPEITPPEITPPEVVPPATDADFMLQLSYKASCYAVGDLLEVYITPTAIKSDAGICSYDIEGLTYDTSALKFTSAAINKTGFNAMINETEDGVLSLMVTDETATGSALKDGEGVVTLKFTVLSKGISQIAITGSVGGTDAETIDRATAEAGEPISVDTAPIHNYIVTEEIAQTCTQSGHLVYTCENCGDSYTVISEAVGHNYETTETVEATCTEDGYTKHECKNCDDSYNEISEAIGHDYSVTEIAEATCTEDGYIKYVCANCDDSHTVENGKALGHDFSVLTETKEPTYDEEGYNKYQCSHCDETSTEILEKRNKGDVSGDGKINSTDFMQIRKHYLGLYSLTEESIALADVNKDGKVNSTDFMQVRKHFLGLYDLYA